MNRRQSRTGTRNSQKANYKQGNNSRGSSRRPSQVPRRQSTQDSILPVSDAGGEVLYEGAEPLSETSPRALYRAPPGYELQSLHYIRQYLEDTRMEENFSQLLRMLMERQTLPYNPYPGLVTRLRPHVEKFYRDSHSPEKIEYVLGTPLQETPVLNLYTPKDNEIVWGLSSVLRTVNPTALQRYRWLTENITPNPDDLYQSEEYSTQVMIALVGPTIFHGTFYAQSHLVQIRLEYLVAGSEATEGVSIFVNCLMKDIDAMYNHPYHKLLGVNIPILVDEDKNEWIQEFWDPSRVQEEKAEFLQNLSDAVIGNKLIYVECVLKLDPGMSTYVRGQKQYGLNFIEVVDEIREEGLMCFSEFPMASLHEGVFLNQSQAEAYITIFSPQLDSVDIQNTKIQSARPGSKVTRRTGQATTQLETDRQSIHIHVHGRLEHFRPRKIRIDGFRLGEDPGFGPFAWQIVTPFKAQLQKNISRYHPHGELFDSLYNIIILVLTDRISYDKDLLPEVYCILHGTPGRLHQLMEHNKAVRGLIRGFAGSDNVHFIRLLLAEYKRDVEEMLANSLQERTSDLTTAGQAMAGQVEDLLSSDDFEFGSTSHLQQVVETFRNMDNYCMTLLIQAVEDAMFWCPKLQALIKKMKETFPEEARRPVTRIRERDSKQKSGVWSSDAAVYTHGHEEEQIMKHEHQVIDVQMCIDRDNAPKIMSTESVLMKYITDTHIDEMWQDFQVELFAGKYLPPNPYTRLVTRCRESVMRVDLCYEKSSNLLSQLLSGTPQEADPDNYVYYMAGCDGYGPRSALAVLDIAAYVNLARLVQQNFSYKNYIHRKGPFRIGVCMGIVGSCLLYGQMQPYLNSITLEEHYYMQGPQGCESEALSLFAKMVYNHLCDLIELSLYPVMGVYMGLDGIRWTWEDILNSRQGFLTEFEMVCTRREPIYFKAYVQLDEWRYVGVKKHFLFHWLTDDHLGKELYFPPDPCSFYQCLFLTKDRAAFHYQNGGPRSGNPLSGPNIRATFQSLDDHILKARDKAQWIDVHRLLLLRALMSQEQCHVVEAWRMLHSIGAEAEYVCHLIEGLQDLTIFAMEYDKWKNLDTSPGTGGKTSNSGAGKAATAKKGKTGATVTERQDPLDKKTMHRMTMAFQQKITNVLDARKAMLPYSMLEFVEMKLKSVFEIEPDTGEAFLVMEDETVIRLEEVKQMMKAVQDILAGDVHNISPEAQAAITAIETAIEDRPTSVASYRLDDPDQYKRRPRARKAILDDDMLYRPR
ncbi:uncharacterized protein LOC124151887 [Haliotis rufescens]|uniref:uncharacterized protein LOC124151887 n=1 Tax=Haliotis rufescens TaxID=6454 RepID=UPI00201EE3FB|nr:uncharacterized protein LOC124151887 [Haliotis rufescens]XP_048252460.1 uncharacterized protein LOC124151887 [Haliotis rufescens]XP_048252461.1 uncharacterized protein LOC124151887 [Haliotis rufescens]